jgi:hypothetical protein
MSITSEGTLVKERDRIQETDRIDSKAACAQTTMSFPSTTISALFFTFPFAARYFALIYLVHMVGGIRQIEVVFVYIKPACRSVAFAEKLAGARRLLG